MLAGYAERSDFEYLEKLRAYGKHLGINVIELNGLYSGIDKGKKIKCGLLDLYTCASIVTYPSQSEGFGNQFLEAVYAKKPVVVWEYPVFNTDIKPLGFEVISLGNNLHFDKTGLAKVSEDLLDKVVYRVIVALMDNKERKKLVDKNFEIAKANFSYQQTFEVLRKMLRF